MKVQRRASSVGIIADRGTRRGPGDTAERGASRAAAVFRDLLVLTRPRMSLADFLRIDTVARFVQRSTAIHPLGAIPPNAAWGSGALSRYLSVANHRVDAWTVGTIERVLLLILADDITTISVSVRLLRECDRSRMLNLQRRTSPKTRLEDLGDGRTFTATLTFPSSGTVFRGFHDATQRVRRASQMEKIGINDLIAGDVVLLQSFFVRQYEQNDAEKWTVSFELSAVSLLYAAPRGTYVGVDTGFRGEL